MPEGDAVRRTADRLHRALSRGIVLASDFRVPSLATTDLRGATVLESTSRGKHLPLRVSGSVAVHTHLRIDASWRLSRIGGPRGGDRSGRSGSC
jgi:endonuclease-8